MVNVKPNIAQQCGQPWMAVIIGDGWFTVGILALSHFVMSKNEDLTNKSRVNRPARIDNFTKTKWTFDSSPYLMPSLRAFNPSAKLGMEIGHVWSHQIKGDQHTWPQLLGYQWTLNMYKSILVLDGKCELFHENITKPRISKHPVYIYMIIYVYNPVNTQTTSLFGHGSAHYLSCNQENI